MADDRKQYRVPGPEAHVLSIAVGDGPTSRVGARAINLSVGGIRVAIDRDAAPQHAVGDTVYVYLRSPHLEDTVSAPALVCARSAGSAADEYSLRFVDWLGLLTRLPPPLTALFNRRVDHRFELDPTDSLEVELCPSGKPGPVVRAWLRDVSPEGISCRARPDAETILAGACHVTVRLTLPGAEGPIAFAALIRHRQVTGDSIRYGVCFDSDLTDEYSAKRAALEAYVSERQGLGMGSPAD